jgi:hypothetical protein
MTPSAGIPRCTRTGATLRSSSAAENASFSIPATIPTFSRGTRRPGRSTSRSWTSLPCPLARRSRGRPVLRAKRESQSEDLRPQGRVRHLWCGLAEQLLSRGRFPTRGTALYGGPPPDVQRGYSDFVRAGEGLKRFGCPQCQGRSKRQTAVAACSTVVFRDSLAYRPITRFFCHSQFLSRHSVPITSVSFEGLSPSTRQQDSERSRHFR